MTVDSTNSFKKETIFVMYINAFTHKLEMQHLLYMRVVLAEYDDKIGLLCMQRKVVSLIP